MANSAAAPPTANFDNANGMAVLEALHTLRFTDKAMSATQGLSWGSLQQQMAQGKLGMHIGAPDDIYNVLVPNHKDHENSSRVPPPPIVTGTTAASPHLSLAL